MGEIHTDPIPGVSAPGYLEAKAGHYVAVRYFCYCRYKHGWNAVR